jgi:sigma54-dependent transcription regulator
MATLASGGRISVDIVDEEMGRLRKGWQNPVLAGEDESIRQLLGEKS